MPVANTTDTLLGLPPCRVRKLTVKTYDPGMVPKAVMLLEDAFRTASIPGHRIFFLRRFSVPPFTPHHSSATLAFTIQESLRHLISTAVHAAHERAAHASCVFFTDPVEPLAILAVKLARGEETSAWFWPLAVPHWHNDLPPEEGLRTVLATAHTRAEEPVLVAHLLETLHAAGALNRLLASLRPQDGPPLCRLVGWETEHAPLTANLQSSQGLESVLPRDSVVNRLGRQWIERWGVEDARSVWLTGMAVIKAAPHLSGHPDHLLKVIHAHLGTLCRQQRTRAEADRESLPDAQTSRGKPSPTHSARSSSRTTDSFFSSFSNEPSSVWKPSSTQRPPEQMERRERGRFASTDSMAPAQTASWRTDLAPRDDQERQGHRLSHAAQTSSALPRNTTAANASFPIPTRQPSNEWDTQWAGLLFLLHVFSRFEIVEWLEQHPALVELDLARQVFRYLLDRMKVPEHDGIWSALDPIPDLVPQPVSHFLAPMSWWTLLRRGETLCLGTLEDRPHLNVLYDRTLRLPLALWMEPASPPLHALMANQPVRRIATPWADFTLDDVLKGWHVAIRRWCESATGLGVYRVIHRPARLAVTPTHLDVIFRLNQLDIAIRKAGLDIDPGWVPWFGRVVHFHYVDEES